ncbi:hypothetical protein [Acidisphaera rubrifaciens]|uniref:Uncharacterized protein n=1 Tax=Acidisphaera rubrifaciens HS-AP3 TaxID=1231350 RepID=A0A0D6P8I2_9PROT|nr:hypothetical protein [Acidisphaera rubrifaciens]GAN78090.1 hypothetical protein Asru_0616_04 [Acidisphaera rubrifaciens HS-AP3]
MIAALAMIAQASAGAYMPSGNVSGGGSGGAGVTVLGLAIPICGHAGDGKSGVPSPGCLLDCARCLCCHAPPVMTAGAPLLPVPVAVRYVPPVLPPPATGPPAPPAALHPPRGPPALLV